MNQSARNEPYYEAIAQSTFGSISRLAEHLGIHYRNVHSYAIFERDPIDRLGYVKPDIAAICRELGCELEALFPKGHIDRPYRFHDGYEEGYGQRAKKTPVKRHFPERQLTDAEVESVIGVLKYAEQIKPEQVDDFVLDIVRRLRPPEYEALRTRLLSAGPGKPNKKIDDMFDKALRTLNSPFNYRKLLKLNGRDIQGNPRAKNSAKAAREADMQQVREYCEKGLLPSRIFEAATDVPAGLSPRVITHWFMKKNIKISADHLAYVLDRCRELDSRS